jgi:hypothetical protein
VLASRTASVPLPESYQRRRRAGASTASQSSIRPTPARENASASWPTTIVRACQIDAGNRRSAYRNAPRSGVSMSWASECRLEFIAACDGSRTRSIVSPDERRSVVYVRW